ncbi:MAG: hypothetical protein Kow0099_15380 [Candidatus Abyssubacteria bacterium]
MNLQDSVEQYLHVRPESVKVHEKVGDFFSINRGDIVMLDGRHYVISGIGRERSFGLDDEPKHWVKYAYEVSTGKRKIIKLVFLEEFELQYGEHAVRCFRSPGKEARALESAKGHLHFMQGHTVITPENEHVRVIDYINGCSLLHIMEDYPSNHERYFREKLPELLHMFIPCLEALHFLHGIGIRHGDVRSDHLILDDELGKLRWIDFDYDYICNEAPLALDLLGVGNIISELVGKGERTIHNLRLHPSFHEAVELLTPDDFSVVERTRLMNWRKLFPYVPDELNNILMHFSAGAEVYYESAEEIAKDLTDVVEVLKKGLGRG